MNKILLLILFLLLAMAIFTLSNTEIKLLESDKKFLNTSSFTKAICKDNFCQDYLFKCNNNKIESISPVTDAAIQFNKEWEDPRSQEQIIKSC